MISYQEIKDWFEKKENKQQVVIAVCFILVFIVGFGSGRFEREFRRERIKPQNNYTTNSDKKLTTQEAQIPVKVVEQGTVVVASSTSVQDCVVKGNISSAGKKIYHITGGAFYKTVKPEQCFNTEGEAVAAGFVKSQR
ncbi:MAG: hypothetical protein WC794_00370 [Candidatus Doudnabacteria bacterium]|jgi:hypothetical protein